MEDLIVKNVDVMGDSIKAAKDNAGNIWVGVRWVCDALDMTEGQMKRQIMNIKKDLVFDEQGSNQILLPTEYGIKEVFCIRHDFIPLWLAKISITDKTKEERPDFARKLMQYQLKAKDILAAAFHSQQPQFPQTTDDKIALLAQGHIEVSQRINGLEKRFNEFQKSLPLLPNEADQVSNTLKKRVVEVLGGKTANAYKNRSLCQKVFVDAYRELKRNFNVTRYKDIKREQLGAALKVASSYTPPVFLVELISVENAQMKLESMGKGGAV